MKLKNTLLIAFSIISTSAIALPATTIEKTYYATAAKETVVGYYYQGCTASAHVSWGVRTNYYDDVHFPHDCTGGVKSLSQTNNNDYSQTSDDSTAESRGVCVIRGIINELSNDGNISATDFDIINSSC